MRDDVMTLVGGRTLAFTDLGDAGAPVAFYFHGVPTSRLHLVAYEDALIDRHQSASGARGRRDCGHCRGRRSSVLQGATVDVRDAHLTEIAR
jgi:hypothetical protein